MDFLASLVLAVGVDNSFFNTTIRQLFVTDNGSPSPAGAISIDQLITVVIQILLLVAASVAVIFLIVGGFRYVVSSGNEEQAEAAKKTMTSAIVGLVVIILAFAIIRIISAILLKGTRGLGELGT